MMTKAWLLVILLSLLFPGCFSPTRVYEFDFSAAHDFQWDGQLRIWRERNEITRVELGPTLRVDFNWDGEPTRAFIGKPGTLIYPRLMELDAGALLAFTIIWRKLQRSVLLTEEEQELLQEMPSC